MVLASDIIKDGILWDKLCEFSVILDQVRTSAAEVYIYIYVSGLLEEMRSSSAHLLIEGTIVSFLVCLKKFKEYFTIRSGKC